MRLQGRSVYTGQPLVAALMRADILEEVMPVHDAVLHQTMLPHFWSAFPKTSIIRDYYGDSVALYFEWMKFMWHWLTVPGIAGLAVYIAHQYTGMGVHSSVTTCSKCSTSELLHAIDVQHSAWIVYTSCLSAKFNAHHRTE